MGSGWVTYWGWGTREDEAVDSTLAWGRKVADGDRRKEAVRDKMPLCGQCAGDQEGRELWQEGRTSRSRADTACGHRMSGPRESVHRGRSIWAEACACLLSGIRIRDS